MAWSYFRNILQPGDVHDIAIDRSHYGEIACVVVGPTETEFSFKGLIEHEIPYSVTGPMLDRHTAKIPAQTSRRLYAVLREKMPSGYGTWTSVLWETLTGAINLRMLNDADSSALKLERLESARFLLMMPLDQALAAYEQSGVPFEHYLPILLASPGLDHADILMIERVRNSSKPGW